MKPREPTNGTTTKAAGLLQLQKCWSHWPSTPWNFNYQSWASLLTIMNCITNHPLSQPLIINTPYFSPWTASLTIMNSINQQLPPSIPGSSPSPTVQGHPTPLGPCRPRRVASSVKASGHSKSNPETFVKDVRTSAPLVIYGWRDGMKRWLYYNDYIIIIRIEMGLDNAYYNGFKWMFNGEYWFILVDKMGRNAKWLMILDDNEDVHDTDQWLMVDQLVLHVVDGWWFSSLMGGKV